MLYHKINHKGFTIIELLVVMVVVGIASIGLVSFVTSNLRQYLGLQKDATAFSDINQQSQRISNVLRGSTDILGAADESITVYAYFFPNKQYVSQINYYLNPSKTTMFADVTPMTANPPNGTLITAQKKTYTIIPYYYQSNGLKLFEYLDANNQSLATPIADLKSIKAIRINLKTPIDGLQKTNHTTMTSQVSLRNRKSNL